MMQFCGNQNGFECVFSVLCIFGRKPITAISVVHQDPLSSPFYFAPAKQMKVHFDANKINFIRNGRSVCTQLFHPDNK